MSNTLIYLGLSCRWNPIKSKKGVVLSLLVESRTDNPAQTYKDTLLKMHEIFDGALEEANPVNTDVATYKSIRECYENEKRFHNSVFSIAFILRFLEIITAVLIFQI
jgi:hypothetical protein